MATGEASALQPKSPPTERKMSRWLLLASVALLFCICGVEGFFLYRIKQQLREQSWSSVADGYTRDADIIQPEVGSIQFLKNGLTVSLTSANYTANGLELAGDIGNSKSIYISSITLHVSAHRPIWECRDKYLRGESLSFYVQGRLFLFACDEVGNGQTGVADLAPGRKQFFTLTIPNVKQTANQVDLLLQLSGERYTY